MLTFIISMHMMFVIYQQISVAQGLKTSPSVLKRPCYQCERQYSPSAQSNQSQAVLLSEHQLTAATFCRNYFTTHQKTL